MREIKYIIVGSIMILFIEGLYFLGPRTKSKMLSEEVIVTATPTSTSAPTETPTPLPTSTPKPILTKKPSPVPTPSPASSEEVNALIDRFSLQYSVDSNFMRHIALCESEFNSNAKNGLYIGLFQFGPVTWQNIRREIGEDQNINLRYSAEESAQTAAYALSKGKRGIWPNCID